MEVHRPSKPHHQPVHPWIFTYFCNTLANVVLRCINRAVKVQTLVAQMELRNTQSIKVVSRVALFRLRESDQFGICRKVEEESTGSSNGSSTPMAVNRNSQFLCAVSHCTIILYQHIVGPWFWNCDCYRQERSVVSRHHNAVCWSHHIASEIRSLWGVSIQHPSYRCWPISPSVFSLRIFQIIAAIVWIICSVDAEQCDRSPLI